MISGFVTLIPIGYSISEATMGYSRVLQSPSAANFHEIKISSKFYLIIFEQESYDGSSINARWCANPKGHYWQIHYNWIDQTLLKYLIYILFRTTTSTNSHYSLHSKVSKIIAPFHSQNSDCCTTGHPGYGLLFLAATSIRYICV